MSSRQLFVTYVIFNATKYAFNAKGHSMASAFRYFYSSLHLPGVNVLFKIKFKYNTSIVSKNSVLQLTHYKHKMVEDNPIVVLFF